MKKQFKASKFKLKNDISSITEKEFDILDSQRLDTIIEELSFAIDQLKSHGLNVELNLSPLLKESHLSFIFNNSKNTRIKIPLSGMLKIEDSKIMISIVTSEYNKEDKNEHDVMKIYLSELEGKDTGKYPVNIICYDMKEDTYALYKLQKHIILISSKWKYIKDHDKENSLGSNKNKPSVIRKPKMPHRL